jgi:hypothetical protein
MPLGTRFPRYIQHFFATVRTYLFFPSGQ